MTRIWKRNERKYGTGEILMLGKVEVASVFNPSVSKGSPTVYRVACTLPGISMKPETIDFPDLQSAKARAERAVDAWFKWIGA